MPPEVPAEPPRSLSKEPVLAAAFKAPDPAEFPADTTALPEVVGPSAEATVTDDAVPVRSLSADLLLEPIRKIMKHILVVSLNSNNISNSPESYILMDQIR